MRAGIFYLKRLLMNQLHLFCLLRFWFIFKLDVVQTQHQIIQVFHKYVVILFIKDFTGLGELNSHDSR